MSAENKTQNIELNLWEGHERPQREDFVNDNVKVDAAVGVLNQAISETNQAVGILSEGLEAVDLKHENHLLSDKPHEFQDETQKRYVYGFRQQDNRLVFVFQEVV